MRIAIIHMGEDVPSDEGYVPLRYGRLAESLVARGDTVVRVSPSFSHFRRQQRPALANDSLEGHHEIVQSPSYGPGVGRERLIFLLQFYKGVWRYMKKNRAAFDIVLVGIPPPGMVAVVRWAVGRGVPIVADVRDLWPDAIAVGPRKKYAAIATAAGKVISRELLLANTAVAVTQTMLDWAPRSRRSIVIPIGMSIRHVEPSLQPSHNAGLKVCFLSNHVHGFDFEPVLEAWKSYCEQTQGAPLLTFIGAKPDGLPNDDETISYLGRVAPTELGDILSTQDVGISPSTAEWEYSLGNKIFDYLSSGLFILHSIDPVITAEMDVAGLSQHCERNKTAWLDAFMQLHQSRAGLRDERASRLGVADKLFGKKANTGVFMSVLDKQVTQNDPGTIGERLE